MLNPIMQLRKLNLVFIVLIYIPYWPRGN